MADELVDVHSLIVNGALDQATAAVPVFGAIVAGAKMLGFGRDPSEPVFLSPFVDETVPKPAGFNAWPAALTPQTWPKARPITVSKTPETSASDGILRTLATAAGPHPQTWGRRSGTWPKWAASLADAVEQHQVVRAAWEFQRAGMDPAWAAWFYSNRGLFVDSKAPLGGQVATLDHAGEPGPGVTHHEWTRDGRGREIVPLGSAGGGRGRVVSSTSSAARISGGVFGFTSSREGGLEVPAGVVGWSVARKPLSEGPAAEARARKFYDAALDRWADEQEERQRRTTIAVGVVQALASGELDELDVQRLVTGFEPGIEDLAEEARVGSRLPGERMNVETLKQSAVLAAGGIVGALLLLA